MNSAGEKAMSITRSIRLDDCTDWGDVGATDDDRAAYEDAVAADIARSYPGAYVTVQCLQIARPRAVVTTRGTDGRILTDNATAEREDEIEEHVLEIARAVWDAGGFWTTRNEEDHAT